MGYVVGMAGALVFAMVWMVLGLRDRIIRLEGELAALGTHVGTRIGQQEDRLLTLEGVGRGRSVRDTGRRG